MLCAACVWSIICCAPALAWHGHACTHGRTHTAHGRMARTSIQLESPDKGGKHWEVFCMGIAWRRRRMAPCGDAGHWPSSRATRLRGAERRARSIQLDRRARHTSTRHAGACVGAALLGAHAVHVDQHKRLHHGELFPSHCTCCTGCGTCQCPVVSGACMCMCTCTKCAMRTFAACAPCARPPRVLHDALLMPVWCTYTLNPWCLCMAGLAWVGGWSGDHGHHCARATHA